MLLRFWADFAGNVMRRLLVFAIATALLAGAAAAADPSGEWRVANGEATIRIDDCGGVLWGIVVWEKARGRVDSQNPDPAARTRATLGMPVLLAMRPTRPNLWEGEVYNAENGKTYASRLALTSPDLLRIEGCVLAGILCGGENWTRLPPSAAARPPAPLRTACSRLPGVAGPAHKGGLK